MRFGRAAAALAIFLLCAAVADRAAGQGRRRLSAYEKLDRIMLAQVLGRMGMTGILEGLKAELEDSDDRLAKLVVDAQLHVARASRLLAPDEAAEREKQLDNAVEKLSEAAEEEPDFDAGLSAWLGFFRARFMLAGTLALQKGEPHAQAVLGLLAEKKDIAALEDITAEAVFHLDALNEAIETNLQEWRTNIKAVLTKVPAIERLKDEMRSDSAWIYLYRGISLPEQAVIDAARKRIEQAATSSGEQREKLLLESLELLRGAPRAAEGDTYGCLQQARAMINGLLGAAGSSENLARRFKWAAGSVGGISRRRSSVLDKASGLVDPYTKKANVTADLKYWSLLLQGVAAREAGRHDAAAEVFEQIRAAAEAEEGNPVPLNCLAEAMFHRARNEIERPQPQVQPGLDAVRGYKDKCLKLLPAARHAGVQIRAVLLKCHLYDRHAAVAARKNDVQRAAMYQLETAAAMFAFEDEYGQLTSRIAELSREGKDVSQLR